MDFTQQEFDEALERAKVFASYAPYTDPATLLASIQQDRFFVEEFVTHLVWSSKIILFEFRLGSVDNISGYVICSAGFELPPVIEYGFHQDPWTKAYLACAYRIFPELLQSRSKPRFFYISGLETYVEFDNWQKPGFKRILFRPWSVVDSEHGLSVHRDPTSHWTKAEVKESLDTFFSGRVRLRA
jgi:hypothetical protein